MNQLYDKIGLNYADLRRPDPKIARYIDRSLGNAQTVINVGAGSGNYEPAQRTITAVEPSAAMIAQRSRPVSNSIQGVAEDLPFDDLSFDAGLAVLTIHHWSDAAKGLSEMRRVVRGRIVLLTFDPDHPGMWLNTYFPELRALDQVNMPPMSLYQDVLGSSETRVIPVPHDCTDGFLYAYWRRPGAYLDPKARAAMSSFYNLANLDDGLRLLRQDLESGAWIEQHHPLMQRDALDCGYRLVIAD